MSPSGRRGRISAIPRSARPPDRPQPRHPAQRAADDRLGVARRPITCPPPLWTPASPSPPSPPRTAPREFGRRHASPRRALAARRRCAGGARRHDRLSQPAQRLAAISAYGELAPYPFGDHRLTILQIGDSHTAADFFSGRVRDRLQQTYGEGGDAFLVPGKPPCRRALRPVRHDASGDWSYETLLRDGDRKRLHLSGFNAVSHHADSDSRSSRATAASTTRPKSLSWSSPTAARPQILLDGEPPARSRSTAAPPRAAFQARNHNRQGFHELEVRTLDDNPVTVTGVEVGREGDGVSYLSIGYPGATVQLLQKLDAANIAEDIRRLAPTSSCSPSAPTRALTTTSTSTPMSRNTSRSCAGCKRRGRVCRWCMVGPADAARPAGQCHAEGVGQHCKPTPTVQTASLESTGNCKLPIPPKLNAVREAQRKLAQKLGAAFWDWSQVQGGVCGAQAWAAANPPLMARDYVHMTLEGYKQSADQFADFLIPLIEGRPAATHVVSNN